jgi:hypothetical protein
MTELPYFRVRQPPSASQSQRKEDILCECCSPACTRAKWMAIARQSMELKSTETAKSLRITIVKLGEVGETDSCAVKDCHSSIEHPSVERYRLICMRNC